MHHGVRTRYEGELHLICKKMSLAGRNAPRGEKNVDNGERVYCRRSDRFGFRTSKSNRTASQEKSAA
jgi:hypothetical protein